MATPRHCKAEDQRGLLPLHVQTVYFFEEGAVRAGFRKVLSQKSLLPKAMGEKCETRWEE